MHTNGNRYRKPPGIKHYSYIGKDTGAEYEILSRPTKDTVELAFRVARRDKGSDLGSVPEPVEADGSRGGGAKDGEVAAEWLVPYDLREMPMIYVTFTEVTRYKRGGGRGLDNRGVAVARLGAKIRD